MVAWWNCSTHTCTCIYIKHLRYNRESLIYSHWMLGFILGSVCHQAQVLEFIGCEDIVIWVILIFCSVGSSLKQLWLNSRDVLLSGSDNCRCPGDPWRGSQTGRGAFCNFFLQVQFCINTNGWMCLQIWETSLPWNVHLPNSLVGPETTIYLSARPINPLSRHHFANEMSVGQILRPPQIWIKFAT